ncbi:MAG: cytochrome c [Dehalococcoidia bacterium]|nr:cytochrome c [Dehalococcoidia bacterium]
MTARRTAIASVAVAVAMLSTLLVVSMARQAASVGDRPSAAVIERCRAIYQGSCATCHGVRGEGEGPGWKTPNADGAYPAPPHDSTGHTWHHADRLLFEIVKDGGARYNSPTFQSRMPAWGATLSDDDIRAVLAYIKTLWGPSERDAQRDLTERSPR